MLLGGCLLLNWVPPPSSPHPPPPAGPRGEVPHMSQESPRPLSTGLVAGPDPGRRIGHRMTAGETKQRGGLWAGIGPVRPTKGTFVVKHRYRWGKNTINYQHIEIAR